MTHATYHDGQNNHSPHAPDRARMLLKELISLLLSGLPDSVRAPIWRRGRTLMNHIRLARGFRYDWRRYRQCSGLFRPDAQGVIEATIVKDYHRIEKGLSLAAPRPGFGMDTIVAVLDNVEYHTRRFGPTRTTRQALNAVSAYVEFNHSHGHDVSQLLERIALLSDQTPNDDPSGGTQLVKRDDVLRAGRIDLTDFFNSRFSIRHFSNIPVSDEAIRNAVAMAQKSPSVCNRQSGCVFVVTDQAKKTALLSLQNGNRGFGEQADRILVITSRLDTFLSAGERYQHWIDGGMFAMSLTYALHSLGVGSCCLNWSVEPKVDQAIRQIEGIPDDHAVIMMLAIGHLPSELLVAQSPRRPLSESLHFI